MNQSAKITLAQQMVHEYGLAGGVTLEEFLERIRLKRQEKLQAKLQAKVEVRIVFEAWRLPRRLTGVSVSMKEEMEGGYTITYLVIFNQIFTGSLLKLIKIHELTHVADGHADEMTLQEWREQWIAFQNDPKKKFKGGSFRVNHGIESDPKQEQITELKANMILPYIIDRIDRDVRTAIRQMHS